jgi:dienelactone hydrolase
MKKTRVLSPAPAARCACKVAAAAVFVLLSGCAAHSPSRHNEAPVGEFAAKGYASAQHDSIAATTFTWWPSAQPVRLALARPARGASTPIVIYLPGLGESSDAGERWRTAWASAGYAVLSVQLLDDDAKAWSSELARAAEFKALGREHYSAAAMSRRVRLLADLVVEGQRRTRAGEASWEHLDWSKVAVAGFDLGAFTTMTVAGEHVPHAEDAAGRVALRAAVVLSPYASLEAGATAARYQDIRVPVMSVSSDVDRDLLGLVEGAYLREAPFARMQGPDKYMLLLQGMPHAALSGSPNARGLTTATETTNRSQESADTSGDDSGQRRRGNRRAGAGDHASRTERPGSGEVQGDARLSPNALQMRMIAVEDISTAFLDAYLKDDPRARQWLASNAQQWLGAAGELRRK